MDSMTITIFAMILLAFSTIIGSAVVFLVKKNLSDKASNIIIGLASGIMISVSFFGLLIPAIEEAEASGYGNLAVIPVVGGFLLGGVVLFLLDRIIPHLHATSKEEEGIKNNSLSKNLKLFLAVTMHNVPEGIAVGLACGLALNSNDPSYMWAALSLAIGISIQNFPEGAAVSISMVDDGMSKSKAFGFGALSGIVEPIAAIATIFIASSLSMLLPYLLFFSAGAMLYVTIEELLPEARKGGYLHHGLWAFMIGFSLMMVLELVL